MDSLLLDNNLVHIPQNHLLLDNLWKSLWDLNDFLHELNDLFLWNDLRDLHGLLHNLFNRLPT